MDGSGWKLKCRNKEKNLQKRNLLLNDTGGTTKNDTRRYPYSTLSFSRSCLLFEGTSLSFICSALKSIFSCRLWLAFDEGEEGEGGEGWLHKEKEKRVHLIPPFLHPRDG